MRRWLASILALVCAQPVAAQPAVQALGADFWAWRAVTQPGGLPPPPPRAGGGGRGGGARPPPDWTPAGVAAQKAKLAAFDARWTALARAPRSATEKTDYRLVGSALARVHWELDHVAAWQRQPRSSRCSRCCCRRRRCSARASTR